MTNQTGQHKAGKKTFIVPLLLAVTAMTAIGATVVWKEQTTLFLHDVLQSIHHDESAPVQQAEQTPSTLKATLAPPIVSWVTQPTLSSRHRLAMAFKVSASAPLRSVKVSIAPIINTPNSEPTNEVMNIPTYFIGHKTLDWDGQMDLTGSLLAGTPVTLRIMAQDNDQREGQSDTVSMTLPEPAFHHPVAKTIYSLRKTLHEDPQNKRLETLRGLAILLQQRDNFEHNGLTLLTLRSAAVRIALDKTSDGLRTALDLLWHAAVLFEDSHPANIARG